MQNLLNDLKKLLEKDERFTVDSDLLKNKIVESALKLDKDLIKLLLSHDKLKEHFFTKVGKATIFDKDKFIKFVSNKQFLPDSYTTFKNKIGLTEDGEYISEKKDVVLSWPYKDCVLEGGQTKEEAKRDEIFWNQTLAPDEIDRLFDPKVFTNFKKYTKDGKKDLTDEENIDFENENLLIKGNNLFAITSLKRAFIGEINFIYIDPPYNTGSQGDTFSYNNSFKHSSWLTFMKNRLDIAKVLLKNDGIICVTIDDYEMPRLWLLLEEIFGEYNHLGTVVIRNNPKGRMTQRKISLVHEYALFFGKSELSNIKKLPIDPSEKSHNYIKDDYGKWYLPVNLRKQGVDSSAKTKNGELSHRFYPIYYDPESGKISSKEKLPVEILPIDTNNEKRIWRRGKNVIDQMYKEGELMVKETSNGMQVYFKFRGGLDGQQPHSIWYDSKFSASEYGTKEVDSLLGERELFSYPKSPNAVKQSILSATNNKNAIILDFFAGSGTTAQAVLELNQEDGGNRKFILVEQLDYINKVTSKRISNFIKREKLKTHFFYCELAKWNQEFVEKIQKEISKKELVGIWEEMQKRAFISWRLDISKFEESAKEFTDLSLENQKKFLLETLDQNQLYINYSEIDDEMYGVSEEDKKLNKEFYENS